jgi:hypothetical protein
VSWKNFVMLGCVLLHSGALLFKAVVLLKGLRSLTLNLLVVTEV